MILINARNVNDALPSCLDVLDRTGVKRESRNGPVVVFPTPVTTLYERPLERVLFAECRDANPFFHFFESLWMLSGRNDLAYVQQFVKTMEKFSDDGLTFHGAYGDRWRNRFAVDQLKLVPELLRRNKDDRRAVLQMWHTDLDLGAQVKDVPCNLMATFQVNAEGALDMTVFNRSNDIVWGCYGANAVHFSYLLEYVAAMAGVPVGRYWQVSVNLHAYLDTLEKVKPLLVDAPDPYRVEPRNDPYRDGRVEPFPLVKDPDAFDGELEMFMADPFAIGFTEPIFKKVAQPLLRAHRVYKGSDDPRRFDAAVLEATSCKATDWRDAATWWLRRRQKRARDNG